MSKNTSVESEKHPYCRLSAWLEGLNNQRPLIETFTGPTKTPACRERIIKFIQDWEKSDRKPRLDHINRAY